MRGLAAVKAFSFGLALLGAAACAQAGRACQAKPLTLQELAQGLSLAESTARQLERSGARLVLLARAGQDLGRYGLQWSHMGLAYRDEDGPQPVWRVLHKLNHCGTARADLFRQGLGEFFLDRPHRYEAAYLRLNPSLEAALLPLLKADVAGLAAVHEPRYSMVAYAWGREYQQSNQWALELLALAAQAAQATDAGQAKAAAGSPEPPASAASPASPASEPARVAADPRSQRARAQTWLHQRGYQPSELRLGTFRRLGARLTMAHIEFDDHPTGPRFAGRIATTTVDSVFAWLPRAGLGEPAEQVRHPQQDQQ